jgi:hypothetical protein
MDAQIDASDSQDSVRSLHGARLLRGRASASFSNVDSGLIVTAVLQGASHETDDRRPYLRPRADLRKDPAEAQPPGAAGDALRASLSTVYPGKSRRAVQRCCRRRIDASPVTTRPSGRHYFVSSSHDPFQN